MSWLKHQFRDPEHAMATIRAVALVGGLIGFCLVLFGALLSRY
jgi:hypothetical protein